LGRSHTGASAPDFLPAKEPAGAPATILGTGPSPAGAGGAPSETTSPVPSTTAPRRRSNDGFTALPYGTTISAMRFAATLIARGHVVRVVACGEPGDSTGQMPDGPEMFYVPELVVPVASHLARRQNTVFGKPVRSVLIAAIEGADVVHIYQPWPLGRAAERIAR
jgi:hypothetical protein